MGPEPDLTTRLRGTLGHAGSIREVKMFGGVCFMLNGNMLVGASSRRGLLVRVGKDGHVRALTRPGASAMEMRGRVMEGYIRVDPVRLDDAALGDWVRLARAFVETLPAKAAGQKPARKTAPKTARKTGGRK